MIREVQPHEIVISACIFAALAGGLLWIGYCAGHRGMPELQADYDATRDAEHELYERAETEGWLDEDDPIRVNVECHGDASDWATIRMANQIGFNADVPVFVHGNCQTHEVVDVTTTGPITSIEDNAGHGPTTPHPVSCPKEFKGLAQDCEEVTFDDGKRFGVMGYRMIENVPQPEGQ